MRNLDLEDSHIKETPANAFDFYTWPFHFLFLKSETIHNFSSGTSINTENKAFKTSDLGPFAK